MLVGGTNFSGTEFGNNEVYTPDDTWVFRTSMPTAS